MRTQNENDLLTIKNKLYDYACNASPTENDLKELKGFLSYYGSRNEIRGNWLYNALKLTAIYDNLPVMSILFKCYPTLDVNWYTHIKDSDFPQISNIETYKSLVLQAIGSGSVKVLDYLVNEKNADLYEESNNLHNTLHFACQINNDNSYACLKILTGKLKNVDKVIQCKEGTNTTKYWTPLHLAAHANHTKKVAHLLSKGANPNLEVNEMSVLTYAVFHKNKEMFNLFLKHPKLSYRALENIKFPELDEVIKIEYTLRKASHKFESNLFQSRRQILDLLDQPPSADEPKDSIRTEAHRVIFNKLDHLVYEILNAVINYDGTNENRNENIKKLFQLITPVYDDCSENLSAQHIQKITENLRLACFKIKLDIENDHFANQHFKHTKSRLATSLDKALPTDNNNRYTEFFVDHEASSSVKEFVALINCIKLPDEWTVFFQNNLILSEDPNDEIKFYNDDNKVRSLQTLAAEINRLKYKLKNDPDSFNDVLVDLQKQIVLAIKANQTSRFFASKTAAHLQAFLDVHLQPKIKDPEYKSHYGEKHLARPAPSMRITMNEDAGL